MNKFLKLSFVTAGILLSGSNSYAQWSKKPSGTSQELTGIRFIHATIGFICGGYNTLIKTTDGGSSWQAVSSAGLPQATYLSLDALSSTNIFVARNGLFVTENGGMSWTEWGTLNNSAYSIQSIKAMNDSTAFITKGGYIFKTTNKGAVWSAVYYNMDLTGPMQFTGNNDTAYAASGRTHDGVTYGTIHKSTDGGNTWTDLKLTSPQIMAMYFRNGRIGYYAAFGNTLYRTMDGGQTWQDFNGPLTAGSDFITGILFQDDNTGYVTTLNGFIYQTQNGGTSWKAEYTGHITNGAYDVPLTALAAVGNKVLVAGHEGTVLKNDGPLSVPAPEKHSVRVYPNPVVNSLTIDLGQAAKYQRLAIFDAAGRRLCTKDIAGQQTVILDMAQYGSGCYTLELAGLNGKYSQKVFVQ